MARKAQRDSAMPSSLQVNCHHLEPTGGGSAAATGIGQIYSSAPEGLRGQATFADDGPHTMLQHLIGISGHAAAGGGTSGEDPPLLDEGAAVIEDCPLQRYRAAGSPDQGMGFVPCRVDDAAQEYHISCLELSHILQGEGCAQIMLGHSITSVALRLAQHWKLMATGREAVWQ